jgi:hypothetical protein
MNRYSYLGRFLEGLLFILIILVIFETYSEDLAVFMNVNANIRKLLLLAGFCFDAIFSLEFIARLIMSGKRGRVGQYIMREGGIIDFIASLPLLVFSSGPLLFMTYLSEGTGFTLPVVGSVGLMAIGNLRFLKIVKTIRIIRIFRFIRAMKLFGKVKTRYVMTPRYVAAPILIVITIAVVALMGFSYLENEKIIQPRAEEVKRIVSAYVAMEDKEDFDLLFADAGSLLMIESDGNTIYRNIDEAVFKESYLNDDFFTEVVDEYVLYLDNKDVKRSHALINMMVFDIIIAVIIVMTTIYRRYFNSHIATPVNVMFKGFKTTDYSTPVRIQENRKDFEMYQLAEQYNTKWLPIKRRIMEIKREKD